MRFGPGMVLFGLALMTLGACGGHECDQGTSLVGGACVSGPACGPGTALDQGVCVPAAEACGSGTVLIDGQCRDPATVLPDVSEPAEPNGLDPGHTPGAFALPAPGAGVTIGGCIDPGDTAAPDFDLFRFDANEPALIEVVVDGYGGLLGGFVMIADNPALHGRDWRRYGVAVASDRARRQVFLPAAGGYGLAIADSRTLLVDPAVPAGDGGTCYLATVTRLEVPAPAPITTTASGAGAGDVAFYRYAPGEGDLLFATAAAPDAAVLIDLVALVSGQYRGSSAASRARGASASVIAGGLGAGDDVLLVVDAVIDVSAPATPYTIDVFSPAPVALPHDGGTVAVAAFGRDDGGAAIPSWAYFDAAAGDVVFFDLWTDAAQGLLVSVFTADLQLVTVPCGPACASYQGHVQIPEAGRYYLALIDPTQAQPGSFALGARREHIRPAALTLGAPESEQLLDSRGDRFYQLDIASLAWLAVSGAALSGFAGELDIRLYDRDGAGELDDEVPVMDAFTLAPGAAVGRVVDHSASLLVRVRDNDFAGGAARFDLLFAERPYADLGAVDETTAIERLGTALAAGDAHYYLVRAAPGSILDVRVTGAMGLDPVFTEYDRVETPRITDQSGVDGIEAPLVVVNESTDWVAFAVTGAGGSAGAYDLTLGGGPPPVYQAAPGAAAHASVCPDDGGAGQLHALRGDSNPWGWPANDEGLSDTPLDVRAVGFRFYGIAVQELTVSSNGWLTFEPGYPGSAAPAHQPLPGSAAPNALIAPLWSDYENVTVCTQVTAGRVVVQWRGNHVTTGALVAMQAVMDATDHRIEVIFAPEHEHDSNNAAIGIEDRLGVRGTLAAYNTAGNAAPGTSWTFTIAP